ncbi:MAG: glycine betaine/L-proline ABC transporter ATP-binding protein [Desulfobacterales bacterium PC51MH44]|nr:MAG: glycine betaine/L-proline ABC transporter ATP-binding protein [Desulfobacterales bacterium PC51MH44]
MSEKVVLKNLFKIFGLNPQRAYKLLEKGYDKDEIFEKTGLNVAVQNANFSVNAGEIFVVMGLSGSGKSTLVRMLNRLIEPTSGEVFIDGENVSRMSKKQLIHLRRHNVSMVFQSFALMPHLSVLQNAAYGLDVAGMPANDREPRAMEALEQVGLKAYANSYPLELSGGMQQRVGLARALAQDPTIMLMDEAFSALDPLIRSEMQDELLKLQDQKERTVIFISHDLHEAMRIGDRIAVMEGGRIVQIGGPDEILKNPADEYVRSFFRGVDPTTVFCAGDIARKNQLTLFRHKGEGLRSSLEQLQGQGRNFSYILDKKERYQGVISVESLIETIEGEENGLEAAFLKDVKPVRADTPLQDVLPIVTQYQCPVPVVDKNDVYTGVISKNEFLKTLEKGIKE